MIRKAIITIILNGLALYITTLIIKDVVYTGGWKFFLIAGLVFGILNTIVKPFLKLLSLPLILLTAGIFMIVLNALILWLVKYVIDVAHFQDVTLTIVQRDSYIWAALVFGAINWMGHFIFKHNE